MSNKYIVSDYGILHKYLVDVVVVLHNTFSNRFIVFEQNSIYINDALIFNKEGNIDLDHPEDKSLHSNKALKFKDVYSNAVNLVIQEINKNKEIK